MLENNASNQGPGKAISSTLNIQNEKPLQGILTCDIFPREFNQLAKHLSNF